LRTICFPFRVDTVDEGVRENIGGNSKCEVHDRVLQTVVTLFLISLWRRLTRSHFPVLLIFGDSVAGCVDVLTEVGDVNRNVILLKDKFWLHDVDVVLEGCECQVGIEVFAVGQQ
jgi:hypothetical protein